MPNFPDYHKSITSELDAVKNRIRNLVRHWLTDGEWKEAALRTVLRRHLPASAAVGRGFIVGRDDPSSQIDLFVLRPDKPILFRDGELAIVTPDVPGAIVEVKTEIKGLTKWQKIAEQLAIQGSICKEAAKNVPWLGIFSYEGNPRQANEILEALCLVQKKTGIAVNCVTSGYDLFVRYWPRDECEPGDSPGADSQREFWRAYELERLSPSYFISNLVDAICNVDRSESGYAWFAHQGGKRPYRIGEKDVGAC